LPLQATLSISPPSHHAEVNGRTSLAHDGRPVLAPHRIRDGSR
jgi:hypothetical protein